MSISLSRLLCHASPYANRWRISSGGILVEKDARKKGRIWLCHRSVVQSTCEHLTGRDGLTVRHFALFQISDQWIRENPVLNCGRPLIYYVTKDIPYHACEFLGVVYVHLDIDDLVAE